MRVLIVGATGLTGRIVARRLLENGATLQGHIEAIAMHRDGSDTSVLPKEIARRVSDLEEPHAAILQGINVVVFAAEAGSDTGPEETAAVNQKGAIALIDLAREEQVDNFVMLSAKGAEAPEKTDESIRHFMRAKRAADDHLVASGLSYSILRPVRLTSGPGTGSVTLAPTVDADDDVSREDLADVLITAMTHAALVDRIAELGSGSTPIDLAVAWLPQGD